jgi:hypothetical protein
MGFKYTVQTFHISEGKQYHDGFKSLFSALLEIWRLKRLKYYGCIYLEIR